MSDINNVEKIINANEKSKQDLRSLSYDELIQTIVEAGEKKFRADQIFDWLHNKCIDDFSEMRNIPKSFISFLEENYCINKVEIEDVLISKIDGTRKYLMKLYDGNIIECVLMKYEYGNSICISSQVGCRMGCKFCASTVDGLVRNLSAGEMLGQIYTVSSDIGEKISHVVIMGSGEPFDNYENLVGFLRLISHQKGQNMSGRNITVSTCGIVPKIRELADLKMQLTLAISLHAAKDEKRKEIMPVANKYTIEEITDACKYYFDMTGRRITFEYSLISGVNDFDDDAINLAKIASKVSSHVNLIPVNPIKERDFEASAKDRVFAFKNKLEKSHVNATVRRTLGRDINASCGQLRKRYLDNNS